MVLELHMGCNLKNIVAIDIYHEAYELNIDGTRKDLILNGPPKPYIPYFKEFYCFEHDKTFKTWKRVLNHLEKFK